MARKHKIQKALTHLVQAIVRFAQKLTSRNTYRFLRTAFVASRRRLQAGFVLPTTTLLILVMMLVVSTLIFRSYQRSTDAITQFQRQEVINSATPAIDRAKAKLELLFKDRNAADVGEEILESVLKKPADPNDDIYKFPDETRVVLPGTGNPVRDIAWKFESDTNGDGEKDTTTVYTIVLRTTVDDMTMAPGLPGELITSDQDKADRLLVRNGPLLAARPDLPNPEACQIKQDDENDENDENSPVFGWFPLGTALFQKNFQVYALSVPNSVVKGETTANRSIATIQYQQDRTFEGLNKWGAWFRSDLELTPGFDFNWNGAVHSEGNLFIKPEKQFRLYLISSENSCFYKPEINSEVSTWGHLVYGAIAGDAKAGTFDLDVYPNSPNSQTVDADTDSTTKTSNFLEMSLNPSNILTNNKSEPRDPDFNFEATTDTATWDSDTNLRKTRVNIGKVSPPPYVDDTYRADNLYGPKPAYEQPEIIEQEGRDTYSVDPPDGFRMGTPISKDEWTLNKPSNRVLKPNEYGLDGYWERRASDPEASDPRLRVIVGERLELGNAFGWKGDADPLYPQQADDGTNIKKGSKGSHEFRQQRTLRDNLAAVQATAVYDGGTTPAAIVATTVHPGTAETLKNSATFETISFAKKDKAEFSRVNNNDLIVTDFFNGRGTNGWEFEVPTAPNQNAINNLVNFAGDFAGDEYDGAFPPKQEAGKVHPFPFLTMWGNFSSLGRNNGSLADNTTQQTAAATLGMLAYNINYLQSYDYEDNQAQLEALDQELITLHDSGDLNPPPDLAGTVLPPHFYISQIPDTGTAPALPRPQLLARLLHTKEQVERDRQYGFTLTRPTANTTQYKLSNLDADGFTYGGKTYRNEPTPDPDHVDSIDVGCDFSQATGNNFFGFGSPSNEATPEAKREAEERFIRLSQLFCSPEPKFPSLYYLFPTVDHDLDGEGDHEQPADEPYITQNQARNYKALSNQAIADMAIQPKKPPQNPADWVLTTITNPTVTNANAVPNDNGRELVRLRPVTGNATNIQVAIKDSAFYNGREHMNVRALNLDLDMLRSYSGLSDGLVYAFREDAVREDAIARPPIEDAADPLTGLPTAMRAVGNLSPRDPKLTPTGISLKPVDYYADPDRRPYGFRLKNGSNISRDGTRRGLTIVSDQPIYIQGNFNLHVTEKGSQEFTDDKPFYQRTDLNPLFARADSDTWRPTEIIGDAITILSDNFCDGSIEDGIIWSHQTRPNLPTPAEYGCPSGGQFTSYLNQNRPNTRPATAAENWMRENPYNPTSPVAISRNGEIMTDSGPYTGNYYRFNTMPGNGKSLNKTPEDTWVNAVLVNGVVPSRQNQSNGGLHNFPRLLEDWKKDQKTNYNLHILGSFIQLNFSNYATGPYEHDAWEPGATPVAGKTSNYNTNAGGQENIFYYMAPNRLWGYDVGLQYMPPGPASSRMQALSDERNEFYREPPANDPYICLLRQTVNFPCN